MILKYEVGNEVKFKKNEQTFYGFVKDILFELGVYYIECREKKQYVVDESNIIQRL